ncbi:hypothetical protein HDU79_011231 [Rhizoclosmatium sp. JEL0117]|nr:hypothetical protein HDU79_011231 [Rhizoclosmatium sp. JEL0117]
MEEDGEVDPLFAAEHDRSDTDAAAESASESESVDAQEPCPICLDTLFATTCLVPCLHTFCLTCISTWAQSSTLCPLCKTVFGEGRHALGRVVFAKPSTQHIQQWAQAERLARIPQVPPIRRRQGPAVNSRTVRDHVNRAPLNTNTLASAEKRAFIYSKGTFAKHIASNMHSRFRPLPPPVQFTRQPLRSKLADWTRRDLRAILGLEDVDIVVEYVVAVLGKYDPQTEDAIQLLRPYLRTKTEHFIHELVGFMRSGLTMEAYDAMVQYGTSPSSSSPGKSRNGNNSSHSYVGSSSSSSDLSSGSGGLQMDKEAQGRDPLSSDSDEDNDEGNPKPTRKKLKGRMSDSEPKSLLSRYIDTKGKSRLIRLVRSRSGSPEHIRFSSDSDPDSSESALVDEGKVGNTSGMTLSTASTSAFQSSDKLSETTRGMQIVGRASTSDIPSTPAPSKREFTIVGRASTSASSSTPLSASLLRKSPTPINLQKDNERVKTLLEEAEIILKSNI